MKFTMVLSISLMAAYSASAQGTFGPLAIDSCSDYLARAMSQIQMGTDLQFLGSAMEPELGGTQELV